MIEGLSERVGKYFKDDPVPCERYGKQAMCRSVHTQETGYADNFSIEEIVFSGQEGDITRYDIAEHLGFYGGYDIAASVEEGEVVEGGEFNSFGLEYTPVPTQAEREGIVLRMFDGFERIIDKETN
jgi:hypothetical protein